jgi:predicted helicase
MNLKKLLLSCKSYKDLIDRTSILSEEAKGAVWEAVVRFQRAEEPGVKVWLLKNTPRRVRDVLGIRKRDLGIDLVEERLFDGKPIYGAVQCKLYHSKPSLGHGDLATFTSYVGTHKNFSYGVVASNVRNVTANFKEALGEHIDKHTTLLDTHWKAKLDGDFWANLHAWLKKKNKKPAPRKLGKEQRAALRLLKQAFGPRRQSRAKNIMACGTGKTLVAYHVSLDFRLVGVFVPSLHLEQQFLDEVRTENQARKRKARYLAIGSDPTVVENGGETDEIQVDPHTINAEYLGTDKDVIIKALREAKTSKIPVYVALPYQSGPLFAACARKAGLMLDLGVFDEAHRTVGEADGLFSHLLFDRHIRIKKRLFMTATPKVYKNGNDSLVDMDGDQYGPVEPAYELSFREAIDSDLLVDYRIVTLLSSSDEVKRNVNVLSKEIRTNIAFSMDQVAAALGVLRAMKEYGIKHVITYHRTIARSKLFKALLSGLNERLKVLPGLYVDHVEGTTKVEDRKDIIDRAVSNGFSVVTNARCLQEGVDEKRFDGVCFVDTKASKIDLVQSIGRPLRLPPKGESKPYGWIIVPTFLKDGADFHDVKTGPWARLAEVIRHLATVDEAIRGEVTAILKGGIRDYLSRGDQRFTGNKKVVGKTLKEIESLYEDLFTRIHESRIDSAGRLTADDFHAVGKDRGIKWLGKVA